MLIKLNFVNHLRNRKRGIPGWRSGLAPAFGPGRDPGDPGSNLTSGSRCMEPASPSACVSASLSLCDYYKEIKILKKTVFLRLPLYMLISVKTIYSFRGVTI